MKFLIQRNRGEYSVDSRIVIDIIKSLHHSLSYRTIERIEDKLELKNYIPIGDLKFVGDWFRTFHGIDHIYPIEVPEILRRDEFLHREYSIVKYEDLPKSGEYFIKDVDNLKNFSYCGDVSLLQNPDSLDADIKIDKYGLYQVSSKLDIVSEYRVIVLDDEIMSVDFYNGVSADSNGGIPGVLVFPDAKWLQKAVNMYMLDSDRPSAYTIDIAVLRSGENAIIEVHDFISCGLYSTVFGSNLLYAYKRGIDYILQKGTKRLKEWSNIK